MYRFSYDDVSLGFSGHISMMVLAGADSGVVRIQTSGDIWVGKFTSDALLICNEDCEIISLCSLHTEQQHKMVGLLKVEKVWLYYRIDHLLLSRLETGYWKVLLPWVHLW